MTRTPPATLGDRLAWARRARFVGRDAECARFDRMLAGEAEPVWFLHGPGGIGKTTLLATLARRAEAAGRIALEIDARHLAATAAGWRQAMQSALPGEAAGDDAVPPPGSVLLVDTFETIAGLEAWLRDEELPRYPADVLVVLAGRTPADPQWRLDPGWSSLAAVTRLAPWSPEEAKEYVASRLGGMTAPDALLARGAGVPLMLALLADAHRRGQDVPATASAERADIALHEALVREILVRFGRDLSDPALRHALDVLTVARTVTVPMLADTHDADTARDVYAWLASLPFVQETAHGLQMHDFVRDAFEAAWIARDPTAIDRAGLDVQRHLARRAPLLGRDEGLRQLKDWMFVVRFTPAGPYLDHRCIDDHRLVPLQGDHDAILALVQGRLGDGMAAATRHWLQHRPQDFQEVRHRDGHLAGVILALELTALDAAVRAVDPPVDQAWNHVLRVRPPRPDGSVLLVRLILDARSDGLPNATVTTAGIWLTQRTLLDPRADWNLSFHHNSEAMGEMFARMVRINWLRREPALDHVLDGRHYGAFVRDYVREPVGPEWRPPQSAAVPDAPPPPGRDDFAQAVRDALRQFTRDESLADNPLRHCRAFRATDGGPAPLPVLRQAIEDAVQALASHPADLKFHRALRLTWLVPGAKQEAVAAELGLPFNTYRYHLARGAERVAQTLWQREVLARRA